VGVPHPDQAAFFTLQAEQSAGRAPTYSRICGQLADSTDVADIIESPPRWDAPLRLMSGLHYLVLADQASWDDVPLALREHRDFLQRFVAEQAVQTNEVQRCWMLLPCFLEVARRYDATTIDVIELGTSAGLNLGWDRFRYRYGAGDWGPADAPLELTGEERRQVPDELLRLSPAVRDRVGIDLNPLDVTTDEGARLLKSFVWFDQTQRLERLDRAITVARSKPPALVPGDIAEVLPGLLARRRDDTLMIVWQTAVLGYLAPERRQLVYDALAAAGSERPLAFVGTSNATDGSHLYYGLTVQTWPGGTREQLAHADFHGAWIDWLDEDERRLRSDPLDSI
jgi:hypothetical protein